jgi:hypothetical protein
MKDDERGLDIGLGGTGATLKGVVVFLVLAFAVTLAIVVGKKMSAEAMAVVIGVVCGILAAVPTSILLLVVLTRQDRQRQEPEEDQGRQGAYPPVVVIQGGSSPALPPGPQAGYWPVQAPGPPVQREFHVVGGDDLAADR